MIALNMPVKTKEAITESVTPAQPQTILEVSNVSKAFGGLWALNDVNCTVLKDQIKGVS